jgi:hypothetical protein
MSRRLNHLARLGRTKKLYLVVSYIVLIKSVFRVVLLCLRRALERLSFGKRRMMIMFSAFFATSIAAFGPARGDYVA